MAFGNGARVVVRVRFVPGAPFGTLQDDGDDSAPRNTSKPESDGGWILDGQVSVVVPDTRSCVTVRLMSVPSPTNTCTARLFDPVAVALLVHVVSMLQRTCTR